MSHFPSSENIITCFGNENNQINYISCWKKENSSHFHPFISGMLSNCNWEEFALGRFPINLIKMDLYLFLSSNSTMHPSSYKHLMLDSVNPLKGLKVQDGKESWAAEMKPLNVSWKRHHLTGQWSKWTVCMIIANPCSKLWDLEMLLSAPLIQANSASSQHN